MTVLHEETNAEQGVREAMVGVDASPGGPCLQLLAPLDETSAIAKFLDRSGPGLQQLAFRVERRRGDRRGSCASAGCACCTTSPGAAPGGSRINFVHPKDAGGVLVELVEPAPAIPAG